MLGTKKGRCLKSGGQRRVSITGDAERTIKGRCLIFGGLRKLQNTELSPKIDVECKELEWSSIKGACNKSKMWQRWIRMCERLLICGWKHGEWTMPCGNRWSVVFWNAMDRRWKHRRMSMPGECINDKRHAREFWNGDHNNDSGMWFVWMNETL